MDPVGSSNYVLGDEDLSFSSDSRQEQAGSLPGGVFDQYYGHQISNFAAAQKYHQETLPAQSYVPSTTHMYTPAASFQAQEFDGRDVLRGLDPYSCDYGWLTPYAKADISQIHSAPSSGRVQSFNGCWVDNEWMGQ